MDVKPLICSASPRDMPDVKAEMDKIKCDKLFAKYYEEFDAYKNLRDYFLKHDEYTHMVLCPDDLMVTSEVFNVLKEAIEKFNLRVLSGICNYDYQNQDKYNCWQSLQKGYGLITNYMTQEEMDRAPGGIIQVQFEGFACTWIRRDVVEEIEFRGVMWEDKSLHSFDWQFAVDCATRGIPLYVHKKAKMLHLACRYGPKMMENWGVGIHPPKMVFEPSS